ncbi:hypothetical protein [Bacillus thermotolerans]|uniref:Uncharacterized protein n=1 Tax=Bacillus thermotolerans TaxID=1221996 RepID=A0A0F5HRB0_BACTR|nr:hypothetical protein [Bacillus thermotolerans]KKB35540.1 hypothetical protein QY95_03393 [Bacillus thermotolerans]KKB36064.1 hypothetical protein QY97_01332 [Bacillus thermotolerans]
MKGESQLTLSSFVTKDQFDLHSYLDHLFHKVYSHASEHLESKAVK